MTGFFKVVGLVVALLAMVGFGICGLCGVVIAFDDPRYASDAFLLGGLGLAIALGLFFLVRALLRSMRNPPA